MVRCIQVIGLTLTLTIAAAAAATGLDIQGSWSRDDGSAKVSIAPCGADLCATNTWIKPGDTDEAVGDKLVMTLRPKSETELEGKAFDERRQKAYRMNVTLGDGTMKTEGCVLEGIVCKSAGWTRIR